MLTRCSHAMLTRCSRDAYAMLCCACVPHAQVIFHKGAASKDLLFLLSGAVDVLSTFDNATPIRRITPGRIDVGLNEPGGRQSLGSEGIFGQSALLGYRRPSTHVAHNQVECLVIERYDLEHLVNADPRAARRFCRMVLREYESHDILQSYAAIWWVSAMRRGSDARAAFTIQLMWKRYCERCVRETDSLHRLLVDAKSDARASGGRGMLRTRLVVNTDDSPLASGELPGRVARGAAMGSAAVPVVSANKQSSGSGSLHFSTAGASTPPSAASSGARSGGPGALNADVIARVLARLESIEAAQQEVRQMLRGVSNGGSARPSAGPSAGPAPGMRSRLVSSARSLAA
jgi:CRP-like cAMP-binding protein